MSAYDGSGIYDTAGANPTLSYSIVTGNSAPAVADLYNAGTFTQSHSKVGNRANA